MEGNIIYIVERDDGDGYPVTIAYFSTLEGACEYISRRQPTTEYMRVDTRLIDVDDLNDLTGE